MKTIEKIDKFIDEAGMPISGGASGINPKDKTGEREGFVQMVANRIVTLQGYGVVSASEAKKVKEAVKKIIKY